MGGVDEPGLPTLYEWAGGLDPLRRMIDAFYDRVEADDALAGFFPGGVSQRHREHVTDWWAEVLGGPTPKTGGPRQAVRGLRPARSSVWSLLPTICPSVGKLRGHRGGPIC